MSEVVLTVCVKWNKNLYELALPTTATVGDLKDEAEIVTGVLCRRQKLLSLKGAPDEQLLTEALAKCQLKDATPLLLLMGTAETDLDAVASRVAVLKEEQANIVDDLADEPEVELQVHENQIYATKLANRIRNYALVVRHEPRPGTKLLVLDIDYTVYDHRSSAESISLLTRPHLLDTLARAYALGFEILFWSATSMRWIDEKLSSMGVYSDPRFRVMACVDFSAMVTLHTAAHGVFNAKPLAVVWAKLPQFSAANTIMFDDLSRNFAFNVNNGVKIQAFRNAPTTRDSDTVLLQMQRFLETIRDAEDISALDNKRLWRQVQSSDLSAVSTND
jgi:ubiquitin-like domain-containing CTD phosphatase 1